MQPHEIQLSATTFDPLGPAGAVASLAVASTIFVRHVLSAATMRRGLLLLVLASLATASGCKCWSCPTPCPPQPACYPCCR